MNGKDLLIALGGVDETYIQEADQLSPRAVVGGRRMRRLVLLAAVLALLLAGCAYAVLRLENLKMGQYIYDGVAVTKPEVRTVLSMQGFVGSDNYRACKEWYDFEQSYDPDREILLSLDTYPEFPREYDNYTVYSQEMKEKVDELSEKYHLDLLGRVLQDQDTKSMFDTLGIQGILNEGVQAERASGYFFQSGTFHMEGSLNLENSVWNYPVQFSFRCVRKTDFDAAWRGLPGVETCLEWTYATKQGTEVLLALNEYFGLIVADSRDFFITICIENPKVGNFLDGEFFMDPGVLEAVAESFDYSIRPQKISDKAADAVWDRYMRQAAEKQRVLEEKQAQFESFIGVESYESRIAHLMTHTLNPERMGFTFLDLDGNGVEELILGEDGYFTDIYTLKDGKTATVLSSMGALRGFAWLREDGCIAFTDAIGDVMNTWVYRIQDGQLVPQEEPGASDRVPVELLPLSMYPLDPIPEPDAQYLSQLRCVAGYESYDDIVKEHILYPADKEPGEKLRYQYALLDLNGDGQKELFIDEEYTKILYTLEDGQPQYVLIGYGLAICENNILELVLDYSGENRTYCYYRMDGNEAVLIDYLRYDADREEPWLRSTDGTGQDMTLEPISDAEADSIRAQYPHLDMEMKPMEEYPLK